MTYEDGARRLLVLRTGINELRQQLRQVLKQIEPQLVRDYVFATADGAVRLSGLFGAKSDLIIVHNMGLSCDYCTLWADGFSGLYAHLADRTAFVVSSPDAPDQQQRFAAARGWRFPMVCHQGTTFAADMGYYSPSRGCLPGISVFQRKGTETFRVSDCPLGPGDDFCALWHVLDLLPGGADGWQPKSTYA